MYIEYFHKTGLYMSILLPVAQQSTNIGQITNVEQVCFTVK